MLSFAAALLWSIVSTGIASTQTLNITSCSATHVLTIDSITITNARFGQTMIFSYTGQLAQALNDSPLLKATMTEKTGGGRIPCIDDLGSCEYKLCGGTSDVEKEISVAWNATCPVPAGNYNSSASFHIPYLTALFIRDGNINVKLEIINGGISLECNQFDVRFEI